MEDRLSKRKYSNRSRSVWEVLASMPIDPDEPLLAVEQNIKNRMYDKQFYKRKRASTHKHKIEIDIHKVRELCSQPLTWGQIGAILGVSDSKVRAFAQIHGIKKTHTPRGIKKTGTALTSKDYQQRYYDKNSPSVEELDNLMIIYKGFIGLLAYKLEKSFHITRNMLKFRGRYEAWLDYNKIHREEICGKS